MSTNEERLKAPRGVVGNNGGRQPDGSTRRMFPAPKHPDIRTSGFAVEVVVSVKSRAADEPRFEIVAEGKYRDHEIGWGMYVDRDRRGWFWVRNHKNLFVGIITDQSLPEGGMAHLCGTCDQRGNVGFFVNGALADVNPGNDSELAWVFSNYEDVIKAVKGDLGCAAQDRRPGIILKEFRLHARPIRRLDDEILNRARPYFQAERKKAGKPLPLVKTNQAGLRILDREIRYCSEPAGRTPKARPLPLTERAMTPSVPPAPKTMPSPYPAGGNLNVYFYDKRALTGNIYGEPGTSLVLHLGITTPGIDDTAAGAAGYAVWYRTSRDGGASFGPLRPVIKRGGEYSLRHPIDGVWVGKNGFAVDMTRRIISASNGEIMAPFSGGTLDENGKSHNPLNSYGYGSAGVLIGKWSEDGGDVIWDFGSWIRVDPGKSSRGLAEPSIVELKRKGEFMLVARGSASRHIFSASGQVWRGYRNPTPDDPPAPRYKWVSYSRDYCRTWSEPAPLTYSDGTELFSPGSCSTLLRSTFNGRLYWIGNLFRPEDCVPDDKSNTRQRHWLVIGEIDEEQPGLKQESVLTLDARHPAYDSSRMALSNFDVYEDPADGNILVVVRRGDYALSFFTRDKPCDDSWYLVGVPPK